MDLFKQILKRNLPHILSLIYFTLAAIYITYPLIFHLSDFVTGTVDQLYIDWIINWNIHSISTDILNILNANIFYPYQTTLAYSDIYITSALISFIPTKIIGEPAVAYNFSFIFSLITLGFCTYLLAFNLTKNRFASIIAGTLVSFSTYTLARPMHLQLLSVEFVLLSILFFIRFLEERKYNNMILSCIFFVLQIYNSFLPAYFIIFSFAIIVVYYFLKKKIKIQILLNKKILTVVFITFFISLPVILPYYKVSKEFNYVRDIRDSIQFANRPEYALYPSDRTIFREFLINTFYKNDKGPFTYEGYMGGAFIILFLFAIIYRILIRKKKYFFFDLFLLIGISSFILSLGPALQWGGKVIKLPFIIPLPYGIFYYIIPGFNGLRNSARWEMLFLITVSICIGIILSFVFKNKHKLFVFLVTALICFSIIIEFTHPFNFYKVPTRENFPKVYYFISSLPKDKVIGEFPMYNWGTFPDVNSESLREYYSTLTYRKTINGYAGFNPPPWQKKAQFLIDNFPKPQSIEFIKKWNVDYVVVHKDEYDLLNLKKHVAGPNDNIVPNGDTVNMILKSNKSLSLIYSDRLSSVYRINKQSE